MKRLFAALILTMTFASTTVLNAQTEGWIDVTSEYVKNPGFDNNSNSGWEYTANASGINVNYNAMEFWQGTFDIFQSLNVPNGKYRVSVQSYFRAKDNATGYQEYISGEEIITGRLYANNDSVPITSIYAHPFSRNNTGINEGWWSYGNYWDNERVFVPNNMNTGTYMFNQGYFNNSIETVVTDGTIKFGLANKEWVANNWCLFDNFKLELYGTVVPVEKLIPSQRSLNLIKGETVQLTYTIQPENATYRSVSWTSSNEAVATVDAKGVITAIGAGSTNITITSDKDHISAICRVTVTVNQATAGSIIINEVQASNVDMFVDPSFNYGSWIELYNPTDQNVGIGGFYVSEDATNLKMHRLSDDYGIVPAKGYKVIWFDHYEASQKQVNFKLDCDGGVIFISNEAGMPIAMLSFPASISRTSYARTTDGGNSWGVTAYPTPGFSNNGSTFATERVAAPIPDQNTRLFTGSLDINVAIPEGSTLIYTTDGTTPTEKNGEISTDGVFNVTETSIFRFRAFQEGKIPSEVITRTFIYQDKNYYLPIISVVTDPINLYDDSLGCYVKGVNGRPGNGQATPCNWNMDWDRPVNFEYLTPDGEMAINQEVDFSMCGGWSRAWTPHSFKLKAGKIYEGRNSMDYPFFEDKPYLKHKTLQIRNGGNDTWNRFKDPALQSIVSTSGIDIDYQAYQPTVHFINGQYIGVINMREPNNKDHAYANHGWDNDSIDQFEMSPDSGYCQKEGTKESFMKWYNLAASLGEDPTNEVVYDSIKAMVDIDEYINYMAVEFYLGGDDWPQNNIKGFKPVVEGGKFRFVLFDLDGAFTKSSNTFSRFEEKQYHTFDKLYGQPVNNWYEEIEMVTIFMNMMENASFRKQFIDTFCLVAGSVFEPKRCVAIIDSLAAKVTPMMQYEGASPSGTANDLKGKLTASRQSTMFNTLYNYERAQLSDAGMLEVQLSANLPQANLFVNNLPVPTNKFGGTLFSPITIKAQAPANFRFVGWADNGDEFESESILFEKGSEWNFYDQGSLDDTEWYNPNNSVAWVNGIAPLGYYTSDSNNGRGYNTFLEYGDDSSNKRPTYYFSKEINLDKAPASDDVFVMSYTADDGFIIYVNGTEAGRYLMPSGDVTYNTFSSTYANGNPDSGTMKLSTSLFKKGTNYIAVEVHNTDAKSSDIYWDASIALTTTSEVYNIYSEEEVLTLPEDGTFNFIAIYEPMTEEEREEANLLPVRINEISADNAININDLWKKNDWIELYNTTDEPIDVAGMYITDNALVLDKWQISAGLTDANTVIAPHDYLIIWCDDLDPVSQLHATFKLAKEGGVVMLSSEDKGWTDYLTYPAHSGDNSVGLYPDGGSNYYVMTRTTLGKSNVMNSYAQYFENEKPETGGDNVIEELDATNSLNIAYHHGRIAISGDADYITLNVSSVAAQTYMQERISLSSGSATVSIETLPRGIYIVTVKDNQGNSKTIKVMKN